MDEKRVTLKIDLRNGIIELDAPADGFDEAVTKTKELADSLDFRAAARPARASEGVEGEAPSADPVSPAPAGSTPPPMREPRARGRAGKASTGRPGRIGSFEEVKGLLTEHQEMELRAFFTQKSPIEQGDRVITAIVKGEQILARKGFNYNEIYTLMRLGGVKPLPKAIDVVLTRMVQDQLVARDEAGFVAKFLGRDLVDEQLPRSAAAKA